ncbi:type II toxin-antitoxin system RelE/ParE family toxin [Pricia sp. S334]|uniref:Toxin n=1 Tax=Pricia mediterranea TaxID=3076079 RepID=A0ABU3L2A6_9FLAO|nr:type II toxin-antitoxin system RelE/ParE family toxin [Pricia sp. S334]MDT7827393.1 type II toxin-antitoxin system RelE/ParE family toxin [Pricia sp. S334]
MNRYVLAEAAKNDLQEIYDFGIYKFGHSQATRYLEGLRGHFEALTKNPDIGKQRDEIKVGLYSLPHVSHIIFYRILTNRIRIVRILHGRSDIPKHLK